MGIDLIVTLTDFLKKLAAAVYKLYQNDKKDGFDYFALKGAFL